MDSQQAVQAEKDRAIQYLFGSRVPWWAKHRWLRLAFYLPLNALTGTSAGGRGREFRLEDSAVSKSA